jgi:hypothetical protein
MTVPLWGFSFAVSGMKRPPAVFSSSEENLTNTLSLSGLNFIEFFSFLYLIRFLLY